MTIKSVCAIIQTSSRERANKERENRKMTTNLNRQIASEITAKILNLDIDTNAIYTSDSNTKNTVFTIGEYILQGFTPEEAPLAREHDILFNRYHSEGITSAELAKMYAITKVLGL